MQGFGRGWKLKLKSADQLFKTLLRVGVGVGVGVELERQQGHRRTLAVLGAVTGNTRNTRNKIKMGAQAQAGAGAPSPPPPPPSAPAPAEEIPQEFEKVIRVETPHHIPITKYRSTRGGYSVVVADIKVPLVSGYFAVATEASSDNGCPHTLEHLIFLGSDSYPYKGVLDSFANKVYARGTNAWTDVDHTCYTIKTAGSEGFLNILPIYLDHILFPTITEPGFRTEVHHINGKGNDAGVVYCEMQSRQNTQGDRMSLE